MRMQRERERKLFTFQFAAAFQLQQISLSSEGGTLSVKKNDVGGVASDNGTAAKK